MRKPEVLTLLLALAAACAGHARDIHVAADGTDAGDGSAGAPYRTVAQGLAQAVAGDRVLLRRGDVFREENLAVGAGVTVTAYGDGAEPPAVSGSVPVGGWTPWSGRAGVWQASVPAISVPQVYVDGVRAVLARWPDTGWLHADGGSTEGVINDAELGTHPLAAPGRWKGATMRWRYWSWWFETRTIMGFDGVRKLTIGYGDALLQATGTGYYIDNTLEELDQPGEWYFDQSKRILYYMPPPGVDPSTLTIEAAVRARGISVSGGTLDGIAIRQFIDQGVGLGNRAGTVTGCLIEQIGNTAIAATWNAGGSLVSANVIRDVLNVGINWIENPSGPGGTIIERNRLERIGMLPGHGGTGSWKAAGVIISNCKALRFRLNRIHQTGYAGIILGNGRPVVERNVFHSCMATLNDGAAIYTNSGYNTIRENIILHTVGDLDSSHRWAPLGHGIWPEFLSNFRGNVITGNTVYGSNGNGIWLPNNFDATVAENVVFSCRTSELHLGGAEPGRSDGITNQNHLIRDNILGVGARPFFQRYPENVNAYVAPHANLTFSTYEDRDLDYGSMSGTTFVTPGTGWLVAFDSTPLTQPQWRAQEAAWADPAARVVTGAAYLFINDTEEALDFPLPAGVDWLDLAGTPAATSVRIQPFRTAVLLAAGGDTSDLPPYQLASEVQAGAGYASWIVRWPVHVTAAAPAHDPDGDSLPNALEYLTGSDPAAASPSPLQPALAGGRPAVTVRLRPGPADLPWSLESSPDLSAWSPLPVPPAPPGARASDPHFTATAELPPDWPFCRLRMGPHP